MATKKTSTKTGRQKAGVEKTCGESHRESPCKSPRESGGKNSRKTSGKGGGKAIEGAGEISRKTRRGESNRR